MSFELIIIVKKIRLQLFKYNSYKFTRIDDYIYNIDLQF